MSDSRTRTGFLLLAFGGAIAACGPPPRAVVVTRPRPVAAAQVITPLPDLPVVQLIEPPRSVFTQRRASQRITLTATNAQVRDLLPVLAEAAGVPLVMGPFVRGRVSVVFRDVPAIDALRAVIEQAGLVVGTSALVEPFPPVVFYQPPVNVNTADAATIKLRFDVTKEMADWLVVGRRK